MLFDENEYPASMSINLSGFISSALPALIDSFMSDLPGSFLPIDMRNAFLVLAAYTASGRKVSAGGGAAAGTAGAIAGAWQSSSYLTDER